MVSDILEKYSDFIKDNLNKDNVYAILGFLSDKGCTNLEDIFTDYLDVFVIDYKEFVNKFDFLNIKYDNKFVEMLNNNLSYLEEFFMM